MRAFSGASLTTYAFGDRLHFSISYQRGWIEVLCSLAIVGSVLREALTQRNFLWITLTILSVGSLVAYYAHGTELILDVSATEVIAGGNVGHVFSKELRLSASEIVSISYEVGSEDESSGLYALGRWRRPCLAPKLSEELCNQIVKAVYGRFPLFGTGDTNPHSILSGDSDDPVRLKLSSHN